MIELTIFPWIKSQLHFITKDEIFQSTTITKNSCISPRNVVNVLCLTFIVQGGRIY